MALTNQRRGDGLLREALGPRVAVLPYLTPGLALAKAVVETYEKNPDVEAVVVAQHGIFTFGEDAPLVREEAREGTVGRTLRVDYPLIARSLQNRTEPGAARPCRR